MVVDTGMTVGLVIVDGEGHEGLADGQLVIVAQDVAWITDVVYAGTMGTVDSTLGYTGMLDPGMVNCEWISWQVLEVCVLEGSYCVTRCRRKDRIPVWPAALRLAT